MDIHKLTAVVLIVSAFLGSQGLAQDPPAWARVSDAQQAAAKQLGIPVAFENPFGMRFVLIPAGKFMMGTSTTPEDFVKNCEFVPYPKGVWISDESPQHEVTLTTPFYMSMCELSQGESAKIVGESKEKLPEGFAGPNMPVCVMDHPGAMKFCEKLRAKEKSLIKAADAAVPYYTLPTEAQWEDACRAGTTTEFSFGDVSSTDRVNYHGDYPYGKSAKKGLVRNRPVACGLLPPNAWGLHEMHGNVHEWMLDCFAKNYTEKSVTDPVGPEKGENIWILYCIRGGSWRDFAHTSRSSFRVIDDWWHRRDWYNSGLRIVVPLDAKGRFAAPKPKEKK
jgi:formylglycine-generating enzyme required for sulfatase activity